MVSPKHIMLSLRLLWDRISWGLYVIVSICKTYCNGLWQNMDPVDGRESHFLVVMPIMRLHNACSTFTDVFVLLNHKETCSQIFLVLSSLILLHSLLDLFVWSIICLPHSGYLPHNNCRRYGQGFFSFFFSYFVLPSSYLVLPLWVKINWFLKNWD